MGSDTDIKDHWMLDNEFTHKEDLTHKNQIILDTINSQIKEHMKVSRFDDTFSVNELENISFSIPDILNRPIVKYVNYINKSQNWIGHVVKITDTEFSAKLIDKDDPTTYEDAQFDIKDVSKGDMELLKLGAVFYWSVGYANQNGQIMKFSLIRFKRIVDLTIDEFDSIIDNATKLNEDLKWD